MNRLRITLVSGEYPPDPGGVGDYTRCLGEALAKRGHTVAVLTIAGGQLLAHTWPAVVGWDGGRVAGDGASPGPWPPAPGQPTRCELPGGCTNNEPAQSSVRGLRPVPRRSPWGWRCWSDIIAAATLLRPQLLHIQYQTGAYHMHPAINLLPWRLHGLPAAPPTLVTFHDLLEPYLFPKAGPLRRWVTLRLARDTDAVVATNAADTAHLAGLVPHLQQIPIGSNIPLAPPAGYDRPQWRAGLGVSEATFLVAYFGLLSPSKGVDLLIEAFSYGPPTWRLLIIGGEAAAAQDRAYAAEVVALIERRGLRERVTITGQIDARSVSGHLLAADCVALPFRDGASLRRGSLLAALSHGCAVVTTFQGAEAALLHDEQDGLLVATGDVDGLAQALRRLAADPALRVRLGAGASKRAAPFTWPAIAAAHEQLYGRVLDQHRG